MRCACLSVSVLGLIVLASAASPGDKKEDKVAFEVFAKGYFVKNNAQLPGNPAYLVLPDKKSYDQIFGLGVVMGAKPKLVDEKLFEANQIASVVKSGSTLWKYDVEKVVRVKNQLIVHYSATGKDSSAKFNSALIVAVPRGDYAEIVFVENGKEVGKHAVKK